VHPAGRDASIRLAPMPAETGRFRTS
jgi:hypothetical protein